MPDDAVRIVYTCFGGTHSSPVAAAIHLGTLPRDTVPSTRQLMDLPLFDKVDGTGRGRLVFAGTDEHGHDVYVLGRGKESAAVVERTIVSAWALLGAQRVPLIVCDTLPCVNVLMRVGGWLSRGAGLVFIGRPIVLYGTRLAYRRLVRLVQEVENHINGLTRACGK